MFLENANHFGWIAFLNIVCLSRQEKYSIYFKVGVPTELQYVPGQQQSGWATTLFARTLRGSGCLTPFNSCFCFGFLIFSSLPHCLLCFPLLLCLLPASVSNGLLHPAHSHPKPHKYNQLLPIYCGLGNNYL